MKLLKQTIIASAIALGISTSASAATLNITNNILMGASDVSVDGQLYDVVFKDATLSTSVTAFTTITSASLASQALLDQVFTGVYDSNPALTNGCSGGVSCSVVTGYLGAQYVYFATARNFSGSNSVSTSYSGSPSLANSDVYTLALWTKKSVSATAVPEPEAYAMMLAGLGLVGFAARRKKQAAKSKVLSQY